MTETYTSGTWIVLRATSGTIAAARYGKRTLPASAAVSWRSC